MALSTQQDYLHSFRVKDFEARTERALDQQPPDLNVLSDLADEAAVFLGGAQTMYKNRYAELFNDIDMVIIEATKRQG